MMLFPLGTDAPVHHQPKGTVLLIAVNFTVYFFQLIAWTMHESFGDFEDYFLQFGIINPSQWVTSIFLHTGFIHVFGNMVFLWSFGMIVEGKIGAAKFVFVYVIIGTLASAIGQAIMIGSDDGAWLGASPAIFGIMMMVLFWGPLSKVKTMVALWFLPPVFKTWGIPVLLFALAAILWEWIAEVYVVGLTEDTQGIPLVMRHLAGAVVGGIVGFWMLESDEVDCEGYDLISITTFSEWHHDEQPEKLEIELHTAEQKSEINQEHKNAAASIQRYLDKRKPDMAIGRFRTLQVMDPSAKWDPKLLFQLIKLLERLKRWDEACEFLDTLAELVPSKSAKANLHKAEIQILKNSRPAEGLNILRGINQEELEGRLLQIYLRLEATAKAKIKEENLKHAS